MSDIICPECGDKKPLSNSIAFDDKVMELLGMVYAIKCKKCDSIFVTELRISVPATEEQLKEVKETIDKEFKKIKK